MWGFLLVADDVHHLLRKRVECCKCVRGGGEGRGGGGRGGIGGECEWAWGVMEVCVRVCVSAKHQHKDQCMHIIINQNPSKQLHIAYVRKQYFKMTYSAEWTSPTNFFSLHFVITGRVSGRQY